MDVQFLPLETFQAERMKTGKEFWLLDILLAQGAFHEVRD